MSDKPIEIRVPIKLGELYGGLAQDARRARETMIPGVAQAQLTLAKTLWHGHDLLANDNSALVPVTATRGMMEQVREHGWEAKDHPEFERLYDLLKRLERKGVHYLLISTVGTA